MYLLSQIWLYLLLACLAGLALGLLLNRICQQRRHAAELAAIQGQHSEARTRSDAALEAAGADRAVLQTRLEALDTEHRLAGERALALGASVDEHQTVRQGLVSEVESLQGRLGALQATYESRLTLLNTETSRAVQLTDELAALQSRHAALEEAHRSALSERAEVAKEAYAALIATQAERDAARVAAAETKAELTRERQAAERQAQALRDAQAAGQSAAQLREQAVHQELALTQTRLQELEAELRTLRLAKLAALVPPPAVPVVVRPAVSAAAAITSAELERLVLAAGAGQQPAPVEVDHQRPDDLKIIDGIGPVNERWLHAHGVHYFWQIASWSPAELAWVANHLPNFGSRVYRENWIAQSAKLAAQQLTR